MVITQHTLIIFLIYLYRFNISNSKKLFQELSRDEGDSFKFDVKNIKWKNYIWNIHIPRLREYLLRGWICINGLQWCNGSEGINFCFTGFTISGRVLRVVEEESCAEINGGFVNVQVELISISNDLINDVFRSQGGNYSLTNITSGKYRFVASHHEYINFVNPPTVYKYRVISDPIIMFIRNERPWYFSHSLPLFDT